MFEKLKKIRDHLRQEIRFYRALHAHPRTPRLAKFFLWAGLAYIFMPFDLIPDFIPVIGHLDDLIIVPGLIYLGYRLVPEEIKKECRERVRREDGVGAE